MYRGLLICINFLAKKSKLKHRGTETDVQPIYADKNSSLACLSLTDEGSALVKEAKPAQVEQSQITVTHWSRVQPNFPNFKRKEKLNTEKSTVQFENTITKSVQLAHPMRMCSPLPSVVVHLYPGRILYSFFLKFLDSLFFFSVSAITFPSL